MRSGFICPSLIPKQSFYNNVRSSFSTKKWDRLRKDCYKAAFYKCEVCGGVGSAHPVECHEVWDFDDENKIQKLVRLISLCPACHEVVHFGLANLRGNAERAIRHMMAVNKMTREECEQIIADCFSVWRHRSQSYWVVDISILGQRHEQNE